MIMSTLDQIVALNASEESSEEDWVEFEQRLVELLGASMCWRGLHTNSRPVSRL
jgi:hypothetical protein